MRSAQEEDARELNLQLLVLIEHRQVTVVLILMEERTIDILGHYVVVPRSAEASFAETNLPIYWHTEMRLTTGDVALVSVIPCTYRESYREKFRFERFKTSIEQSSLHNFSPCHATISPMDFLNI